MCINQNEIYKYNSISFLLRTKCKRLTQTDDDTNGNNLFGEEEMCKKCSTPWFDANFSLSIAPIKTTKRQAQKIHKQIEKKSNRKSNLAKKLSKKVNNTVVRLKLEHFIFKKKNIFHFHFIFFNCRQPHVNYATLKIGFYCGKNHQLQKRVPKTNRA